MTLTNLVSDRLSRNYRVAHAINLAVNDGIEIVASTVGIPASAVTGLLEGATIGTIICLRNCFF